ncbi:MAG: RagB/SusD family nutrient uptake outer membrane protein, partial [Tannerellaceae bacterium]|nr:RagB/SusD family nutrient uptake outer membrane protein [Tannerellaceae bacterium]
MKTMIYKTALAMISFVVLFGCDDFLDYEQYGTAGTAEQYWKTENDVKNAILGFYTFCYEEGVTGRGFMWFENCSDNLVTGRSQAEGDQIKNFLMAPENTRDARDNFENMYQVIGRTNELLKNVPDMNISGTFKTQALGEAYFFRAFAYLWLVPWYGDNGPNGGLPILTEDTPAENIDSPRPQSVLENYDLIISDMRKAGDMLPLFSQMDKNDYGHPHKAAAWAFAARAALYAAQYDSKYYSIVLEMCDKVIGLTGADRRDLFDDNSNNPFANLWRRENNFCSEYIFSLLGNANQGPKFHGMSFQNGGWNAYNTWGYFQPTLELYKAFEQGDKRREATILYPGEKIMFVGAERTFGVNPSAISSTSGMTFRKFMSPWEP